MLHHPFRSLVVAALVLAPFAGSPAAAQQTGTTGPASGSTIIDFESFLNGSQIVTPLAGVTVTGGVCANDKFGTAPTGPGFFASQIAASNFADFGDDCGFPAFQPFTFTFSQSITAFGFLAVTAGDTDENDIGGPIFFSTAGGTISIPAAFDLNTQTAGWVGFSDTTPFTSVTISVAGNGAIAFDDVAFVTATPEPASAGLLATGLIGMAVVLRRRRKTVA